MSLLGKKNNLHRAIYKARPFREGCWAGCFTSSEIVCLVKGGAVPVVSCQNLVTRAKNNVRAGYAGPDWFYFTPGGLVKRLIEQERKKAKVTIGPEF